MQRRAFIRSACLASAACLSTGSAVAGSLAVKSIAPSDVKTIKKSLFNEVRTIAFNNDLDIEIAAFGVEAFIVSSLMGRKKLVATEDTGKALIKQFVSVCSINKQLVLLDKSNRRLEYFSLAGEFVKAIDISAFSQSPQTIRSAGNYIWLLDSATHQVTLLTPEGDLFNRWGKLGEADNYLNGPIDIAFDFNGNAHILEMGNHRISVWNLAGQWLRSYAENELDAGARGLLFDASGQALVLDSWQQSLLYFDKNGHKVKTETVKALQSGHVKFISYAPEKGVYLSI